MKPLTGILNLGSQYTGTREKIITNIEKGNLYANKRIAGIPCPDSITTNEMLEFFTEENLQVSKIKDNLQKAGLPFQAIVPTAFYNEIKQKKEVYTFKNIDDEGFTSVSEETVKTFVKKEEAAFDKSSKTALFLLVIIPCIVALAISEYYTWQWEVIHHDTTADRVWYFCWFNVLIGIAIGLLWWGLTEGFKFLLERSVFSASAFWKKLTLKLTAKSHKIFWPHYQDDVSGQMVKLDFIAATSESIPQNILQWKQAGYDVNISAQKEAFSIDINPLKNFLQPLLKQIAEVRKSELQARIEARRLFWKSLFSDPIISAEIGEFTVLIDAYGGKSFVSEREVMESVQEYYAEKLKQFQTFLN